MEDANQIVEDVVGYFQSMCKRSLVHNWSINGTDWSLLKQQSQFELQKLF